MQRGYWVSMLTMSSARDDGRGRPWRRQGSLPVQCVQPLSSGARCRPIYRPPNIALYIRNCWDVHLNKDYFCTAVHPTTIGDIQNLHVRILLPGKTSESCCRLVDIVSAVPLGQTFARNARTQTGQARMASIRRRTPTHQSSRTSSRMSRTMQQDVRRAA
jgi:hypothetical protein